MPQGIASPRPLHDVSRRPRAPFLCLHLCLCFAFRENRPRNGGICVANHTSPIDVIILASDGYYAMVRSAPQLCLPCRAARVVGPAAYCVGQGGGSKRLLSVQNCLSLRDIAGHSAPVHRYPVVRGLGSEQSASPAGPPAMWKTLEATSVLPARAWVFSSQPCQGRGGEMKLSLAVKLEPPWPPCVAVSHNMCLPAPFRWVRSMGGSWV